MSMASTLRVSTRTMIGRDGPLDALKYGYARFLTLGVSMAPFALFGPTTGLAPAGRQEFDAHACSQLNHNKHHDANGAEHAERFDSKEVARVACFPIAPPRVITMRESRRRNLIRAVAPP